MKRLLTILLLMFMVFPILAACGTTTGTGTETTNPDATTTITTAVNTEGTTTTTTAMETTTLPVRTGITGLSWTNAVTDYEGTWTIVKVYADGSVSDAVADAITLTITLELDPYELVDIETYIHNQLYNLTGILEFGIEDINTILSADDVSYFGGSAYWTSFVLGEVAEEGEFFHQPGPATMSFRDLDYYGLYLDLVAGITADIDTLNKNLIIGMNNDGQLLLGYSNVHIENPFVEGDWEYCLIFDKVQ